MEVFITVRVYLELKIRIDIYMAKIRFSIIATAILALVVGAGIAYVGIPTIDPKYNTNNVKTTQILPQTGIINETFKSWQDEAYIFDNNIQWSIMNRTQVNFTISANSQIFIQFSAPFLLTLYSTFNTLAEYQVALVIQGVGNTTIPIVYYNNAPTNGYMRQINYYPTLSFMTAPLPAGTYNCSVQWRSVQNQNGNGSNFSASHHNISSTYHYDRWMLLEEIKS